jgi:uncharacterized membrane protein
MEDLFRELFGSVALAIEACATLLLAYGAAQAMVGIVATLISPSPLRRRKEVWVQFAVWLVLALEFELAADIIRTAISPSWTDVGQLASIAAIRTFLNYFLEKDLEKYAEPAEKVAKDRPLVRQAHVAG